jgi:methylase of polypeptide subunit release factors
MDNTSKKVQEMYRLFPYPIPTSEIRKSDELLNLLRIFELENSYKMEGRRILDAGTGTGHRLLRVASHFKNNRYYANRFF